MNRTTAAAIAVLGLLAGLNAFVLLLFSVAIGVAAAGEAFRLVRARGVKPAALAGLAGIIALFVVAYLRGERSTAYLPAVLAAVIGASFLSMMVRRGRNETTRAIAYTALTVLSVGLFGAYVIALRTVSFRLFFGLILMVLGAEAARGLGRHATTSWARSLAASLAGALAVAVILALSMHVPFTWGRAIVLSVLVAAVVPLGARAVDLIERDVVTEPGVRRPRAELLRQVDGVLVSAPVFYYAFRVLAR